MDSGVHDNTDWGYSFAVRCYDCFDSANGDVIIYLGSEEEDPVTIWGPSASVLRNERLPIAR